MPPSASDAPLAPFRNPDGTAPHADAVLERFLAVTTERGLSLYPEQEEAILELFAGQNVVLNTPTGSGKSLVAAAFHYKALCAGERSVYTCPIKALVNEKFLSLCRDFGPENVGMMTGDASVNPQAPVLCCTAEILANIALHRGDRSDLRVVIMDEFHYYSDPERGYAWQVPLLTMPQARFLLMSATLGATEFFEKELTRLTGVPSVTVRSDRRPVPLEFEYSEVPLTERVAELLMTKRAPVYLVYFTQRSASDAAQDLMSLAVCSKEEKAALQAELEGVRFTSPYGKEMRRWLRHGIGVHHAGLLPKYRILVEQLAQKGLLKLICGTDTLGVGINVPIRTVVFTQLWKYDGRKAAILSVRDFRQISGRAGRKGYDDTGYVIIQAPEHVVENKRAEEKAAKDPSRKKKVAKQSAPDGAVSWDARTFERLRTAPPEELSSRFDVSHGMLLLVLSRDTDGCRAMQRLIRDSHETDHRKRLLRKRAWQLFRALVDRKIVEIAPKPERATAAQPLGLVAPTGQKVIAQGNALGNTDHEPQSPEGATPHTPPFSTPAKGEHATAAQPLGLAAPTGQKVIAQGNALGKTDQEPKSPEGATPHTPPFSTPAKGEHATAAQPLGFVAPTGQKVIAQGNALGNADQQPQSPEGATPHTPPFSTAKGEHAAAAQPLGLSAPTGQKVIAQGNALGITDQKRQSPEGATPHAPPFSTPSTGERAAPAHAAAAQPAGLVAPTGQKVIAQGNALGITDQEPQSPEGATPHSPPFSTPSTGERAPPAPAAPHLGSVAPTGQKVIAQGNALGITDQQRQSPEGATPHSPAPAPRATKLRVNVELQDDFSLHQALSLYLIDTLPLLNRDSPDYPFDVLTLCEAIVEDPDAILRRQVDKLKTDKLAEMRAAGVEYEERMEKLDQIEHPKPLRDFLYDTFNAFAVAHPWVEQENVRPKSIAREMFERYMSFADYIREYGLQRSEGLLLRHLSQAWKVLAQTVPATAKTEQVVEMEEYFRELIRSIDSSLLEEWERLRNPDFEAADATADKPARPATFDITRDAVAFRRLVRTTIFGFLQDVAARDWESAASRLLLGEAGSAMENAPLSPEARRIETAFAPYFDAHGRFRLDPEGRSTKHTHWDETKSTEWHLAQVLIDAEDHNDWEARFTLSLADSRTHNRPILRFDTVTPIGA